MIVAGLDGGAVDVAVTEAASGEVADACVGIGVVLADGDAGVWGYGAGAAGGGEFVLQDVRAGSVGVATRIPVDDILSVRKGAEEG